MSDTAISHKEGYSIVHSPEKKYPYTSIACYEEDKWILKRVAAERKIKMVDLVHELTMFSQAKPIEIPDAVKELFGFIDRVEKK